MRYFMVQLPILLLALLALTALEPVATFHDVTPGRVIDGDTWDAQIRLAPLGITLDARLRPLGFDCAELRGTEKELGLAQKIALEDLLAGATRHRVDLYDRDSFGRWLVRAWADSTEVRPYMLAQGCEAA